MKENFTKEGTKIGIAILCRYNSSRLPGKALKKIEGLPIIQHIHNRLAKLFPKVNLVIATSIEQTDDPIYEFCTQHDIQIHRGSLENVAKRFLEVGQQYNWDYIIRINGDNLFIDLDTIEEMVKIAQTNQYDFISNVKGRTFPYGMSIEIVRVSFYQAIFESLTESKYQEHVTLYLYDNPTIGKQFHLLNTKVPKMQGVKMAIDVQEDFDFAVQMMTVLKETDYNYSLKDLEKITYKINATKLER